MRVKKVEIRVSEAEMSAWKAKADEAGVSLSDLVRGAVARTRTWTCADRESARERTRQLARLGNNLNQIARWANTHKKGAEAAQVLTGLAEIERQLSALRS